MFSGRSGPRIMMLEAFCAAADTYRLFGVMAAGSVEVPEACSWVCSPAMFEMAGTIDGPPAGCSLASLPWSALCSVTVNSPDFVDHLVIIIGCELVTSLCLLRKTLPLRPA